MFEMNDMQKKMDSKAKEIFEIKINTVLKPAFASVDHTVEALSTNEPMLNFIKTNNTHKKEEIEQIFLAIATSNNQIMQARLISSNGKELIRVDRKKENEKPFIVLEEKLQDKSGRDYFQIVSKMTTSTIWHSKFDLNIENGKIEVPYKPTMRVALPLFDDGVFSGMVIVNLLTNNLLLAIGESTAFEHFIIDQDKNYIFHPNKHFSFNKYTEVKRDLKEDFPDGLAGVGVYSFPLESILQNGEQAIFVLKTKEKFQETLINNRIKIIILVLILTIILSFLLALYLSKKPVALQNALMKANEKLNQFGAIIDKYVITATTKPDSTIVEVSSAFENNCGYSKDELIGQKINIINHPEENKTIFQGLWNTILSGTTWIGEIKNKNKDGESYWLKQHIIPTINAKNNTIESFVSIGIDITAKKELEELASIDALTRLYNRRMIDKFAKNEVESVKRHSKHLSIIMIDIDHFKSVNDTYGHQVGDDILTQMAKLILDNTRQSDIQGRYGGEEFIIICPHTALESALLVAEKIRIAVENFQFDVVGNKTISLGVATFEANDDVASLIKKADDALYKAKNSGRNKVVTLSN
jgi:diguanylate cyclase (GGDEF)-like protein/PAS domain S-box-containing protein